MRIVRADAVTVAAPFPEPLRFAERPMSLNTAVIVRLEDSSGASGLGYVPTFGFGTEAVRSLVADDFAPRILLAELESTSCAVAEMSDAAAISGRLAGPGRQAIATLEMALLDIESKLAGMPLHQLWSQAVEDVRIYASGGWRYFSIEELERFAIQRVREGFDAIKVQVGLSPREDVARLRALRDVVGPAVVLMLDANQRIDGDGALDWIRSLAPFDPLWLEEPLRAERHADLATLRRSSTVPIAAGESETEPLELADLLEQEALDVLQPDVHRVGLIAARDIRDRAWQADVVVAPHMAHEVSVHLLSGGSGEGWLEYFDWFEDWWETPLLPSAGGRVAPLPIAGHGLELREGWLEAHAV